MEEVHIQTISEMRLEGYAHYLGRRETLSGCRYLKIDENSLRGLQIFQEDAHPSIVEIGGSKEGFSLFGLMDRCVTLPVTNSHIISVYASCSKGRRLLHSWFLKPLLNLEVVNDRLDTIQFLRSNSQLLDTLRSSLKHVDKY